MESQNTLEELYIGKKRFQHKAEANRRRYHQSSSSSRVTAWAISEIRPYIGEGPVLDLACGNGRHAKDLIKGTQVLVAADISLPMLKQVKTHLRDVQKVRPIRLEAEHLPYSSDSFDVTFSARFFHHLPRNVRSRVLGEIFRVSRNGALITMKKRFSFEHFRTAFRYLLRGKPFQYQRYFVSIREFDKVAREHGWRVKSAYSPYAIISGNCAVLFEPISEDQ